MKTTEPQATLVTMTTHDKVQLLTRNTRAFTALITSISTLVTVFLLHSLFITDNSATILLNQSPRRPHRHHAVYRVSTGIPSGFSVRVEDEKDEDLKNLNALDRTSLLSMYRADQISLGDAIYASVSVSSTPHTHTLSRSTLYFISLASIRDVCDAFIRTDTNDAKVLRKAVFFISSRKVTPRRPPIAYALQRAVKYIVVVGSNADQLTALSRATKSRRVSTVYHDQSAGTFSLDRYVQGRQKLMKQRMLLVVLNTGTRDAEVIEKGMQQVLKAGRVEKLLFKFNLNSFTYSRDNAKRSMNVLFSNDMHCAHLALKRANSIKFVNSTQTGDAAINTPVFRQPINSTTVGDFYDFVYRSGWQIVDIICMKR